MSLDPMFDGWVHYVEPNVDFLVPGHLVCTEIEVDEDEKIDPYESGNPIVRWQPKRGGYQDGTEPEGREEEACWAGLDLALKSLASIVGGSCKAYQENTYDEKHNVTRRYSFQFIPGESGYQEGRL
jgi:hypothetical protein